MFYEHSPICCVGLDLDKHNLFVQVEINTLSTKQEKNLEPLRRQRW